MVFPWFLRVLGAFAASHGASSTHVPPPLVDGIWTSLIRREQGGLEHRSPARDAPTNINSGILPGVVVRHNHSAAALVESEPDAGSMMSLQAAQASLARSAATIASAEQTMADALKAEAMNQAELKQQLKLTAAANEYGPGAGLYSPSMHSNAPSQSLGGGLPQQAEAEHDEHLAQQQQAYSQHMQQLFEQQRQEHLQQAQAQEQLQRATQEQQQQDQQQQQYAPSAGSYANPGNDAKLRQSNFLNQMLKNAGFNPHRQDDQDGGALTEYTVHARGKADPIVTGTMTERGGSGIGGPQIWAENGGSGSVSGQRVNPDGTMSWNNAYPQPLESTDCTWIWETAWKLECKSQNVYKRWEWTRDGKKFQWSGQHRRRGTWKWLQGPEFAANSIQDLLPAGNPLQEAATDVAAEEAQGEPEEGKKYEDPRTQAYDELGAQFTSNLNAGKQSGGRDERWDSYKQGQ